MSGLLGRVVNVRHRQQVHNYAKPRQQDGGARIVLQWKLMFGANPLKSKSVKSHVRVKNLYFLLDKPFSLNYK